MKNIIIIIVFSLSSCVSVNKHVWVPEEPQRAETRSDYSSTDLVLTSFQVLNLDEKDNYEDIRYLRGKFIRYLGARNKFREVRDINLDAKLPGDKDYLTMEVVVTPAYSHYRTYILDILFFFPYTFIWPLTPVWGTASVNVKMDLFDRFGELIESLSVQGEDAYWMLFYTFYRTSPIENALKEAYFVAFNKSSEMLAGDRDLVISYLDSLPAAGPSDILPLHVRKQDNRVKKSIAVLQLNAIGVTTVESQAISNRLTSELFRSKLFAVVEREKINEILEEQGFQMTGCTTSECLVEAGRLLSVELMLGGSISKLGNFYSLELRIIDVEKGAILSVASVDIKGEIDKVMTEGIKIAIRQLAGNY